MAARALTASAVSACFSKQSADNNELVGGPGKISRYLCCRRGVFREGNSRGFKKEIRTRAISRAIKCNLGETVLDDFELRPGAAHATAEVGHLRYGHAFIARHHDRAASCEDVVESLNHLLFFSSIHRFSPF